MLVNAENKRSYATHNSLFFLKKARHTCRNTIPKWKPSSRLLQSYLKAHRRFCLVLLRSGSDTVHKVLLLKTLLSSLLAGCDLPYHIPKSAVNPAIVDLRLQGTTSSPFSLAVVLYHKATKNQVKILYKKVFKS